MRITYKDGNISIDLHELLCSVKAEDKISFVESLSCDEDIIRHVTDQIISGWTENCYCGSTSCSASDVPVYALDRARREIAKMSGDIAKREIEALEKSLTRTKKDYFDLLNDIDCRRHANSL